MATPFAAKLRVLALLGLAFSLFLGTIIPSRAAIPVSGPLAPPLSHHAEREIEQTPDLTALIQTTKNGDPDTLVGVYVANTLALPVVQQPTGQDVYVSDEKGVVTQYQPAARYGTIGLLAHNTLSGSQFFQLRLGQWVRLVYGDGNKRLYQISAIRLFQALQPESPYSRFIDLDKPQTELSSTDVFNQIYTNGDQVVFQTCIARGAAASWGRIFIIATPIVSPLKLFYP